VSWLIQSWRYNTRHDDGGGGDGMVMSALKAKLMPTRFDGMSPLMAAIVGYVLGEACCQNLEFRI
jgi:hypothetical protein